jgi:hypothetical protein
VSEAVAVLEHALAAASFTLRVGKHRVWRHHPTGVTVTFSATPGVKRAFLNQRADTRRALRAVGAVVTV